MEQTVAKVVIFAGGGAGGIIISGNGDYAWCWPLWPRSSNCSPATIPMHELSQLPPAIVDHNFMVSVSEITLCVAPTAYGWFGQQNRAHPMQEACNCLRGRRWTQATR